jgi:hypothetical protein
LIAWPAARRAFVEQPFFFAQMASRKPTTFRRCPRPVKQPPHLENLAIRDIL